MGAFISLAFQWRGKLSDLSPLHGVLTSAGLQLVDPGEVAEGQCISLWSFLIDGEKQELICRNYDAGAYTSTTLDIEEERFDEIATRVGRRHLINVFVDLGVKLLRGLDLRYVFFEQEAEADLDPDAFDGSRLFGITILPDHVLWLERALNRDDIQRVDRVPGARIVYRRPDPVPHVETPI